MGSEIVTLEQNVKARMKEIISGLIPEAMWDDLVRKHVAQFVQEELPNLVKQELREKYKELLKQEFSKPEWTSTQWANGRQLGSEMVKEVITESAASILASMIGGVAQQVIYDIQNRLR